MAMHTHNLGPAWPGKLHFYFYSATRQGFFSKFSIGGTQNFRSPTETKSDGGGDLQKNQTEAETAHLMQN